MDFNSEKGVGNLIKKGNRLMNLLDDAGLWWVGIGLLVLTFVPYLILGTGSVFEIHDQLDETILSYVLNAKYFGADVEMFPELLGGINKTGLQPSAVIFVLLYAVFPTFMAFLIQSAVVFLSGFMGMYFSVKRLTDSSILAVILASCFCSLPLQPIYGLSCMGVPLLLYAFLCLYDRKHLVAAYGIILFFGLSTHLVLIGYVVLGIWACYVLYMLLKKKRNWHILYGFVLLTAVYLVVNNQLVLEFLLGSSAYVSHREETVNSAMDFVASVADMFLHSSQHAISLHEKLIIPIVAFLVLGAIFYKKLQKKEQGLYKAAVAVFVMLFGIALFYGFCKTELVVNWKNGQQGFFRYFQAERVYWLYPAGWYLEAGLVFGVFWRSVKSSLCKVVILVVLLAPTLLLIKVNCNFYMNINQINNGSAITGYISWESYYAEDLMQLLEDAIGREISSYRIAHLGISPTPALMHGFYTVDGYSNNYPLGYKHRFRKVIAQELEKNPAAAAYFDTWGSRCYLFNSQSGTYYLLSKNDGVVYENLEFDMEALKELGCEYIFSGGQILDAEEMGLRTMGYFETEKSYWGIWLYHVE